jgi:hypothetical protein
MLQKSRRRNVEKLKESLLGTTDYSGVPFLYPSSGSSGSFLFGEGKESKRRMGNCQKTFWDYSRYPTCLFQFFPRIFSGVYGVLRCLDLLKTKNIKVTCGRYPPLPYSCQGIYSYNQALKPSVGYLR